MVQRALRWTANSGTNQHRASRSCSPSPNLLDKKKCFALKIKTKFWSQRVVMYTLLQVFISKFSASVFPEHRLQRQNEIFIAQSSTHNNVTHRNTSKRRREIISGTPSIWKILHVTDTIFYHITTSTYFFLQSHFWSEGDALFLSIKLSRPQIKTAIKSNTLFLRTQKKHRKLSRPHSLLFNYNTISLRTQKRHKN